jgi:hypothetical protein
MLPGVAMRPREAAAALSARALSRYLIWTRG